MGKWFWWRSILIENAEYDLNGTEYDDFNHKVALVVTLTV
ncbi:hypothetical protein LBKG_00212 [Lactobacillus crispatus CTV-05]|nr:hypothetical protein LBKG_00212 [Lactobacillus crispatus CTV-05]